MTDTTTPRIGGFVCATNGGRWGWGATPADAKAKAGLSRVAYSQGKRWGVYSIPDTFQDAFVDQMGGLRAYPIDPDARHGFSTPLVEDRWA